MIENNEDKYQITKTNNQTNPKNQLPKFQTSRLVLEYWCLMLI